MWPHGILGLSWAEVVAVLTIIGVVYGAFHRLLKNFGENIAKPIMEKMGQLSKSIDNLTENSLKEHNNFDHRLDKHDIRLGKHDADIGTIFRVIGIPKSTEEHTHEH
jgi:hypothetical protein